MQFPILPADPSPLHVMLLAAVAALGVVVMIAVALARSLFYVRLRGLDGGGAVSTVHCIRKPAVAKRALLCRLQGEDPNEHRTGRLTRRRTPLDAADCHELCWGHLGEAIGVGAGREGREERTLDGGGVLGAAAAAHTEGLEAKGCWIFCLYPCPSSSFLLSTPRSPMPHPPPPPPPQTTTTTITIIIIIAVVILSLSCSSAALPGAQGGIFQV